MPATWLMPAPVQASAMASTVKRKASTSASSGVMSLKTTPGLGKSGMSRRWDRSHDASVTIGPGYGGGD